MHVMHAIAAGNLPIVQELEVAIARFVGKQDAIVFGMGFATNSTNMRALVSKVRLGERGDLFRPCDTPIALPPRVVS